MTRSTLVPKNKQKKLPPGHEIRARHKAHGLTVRELQKQAGKPKIRKHRHEAKVLKLNSPTANFDVWATTPKPMERKEPVRSRNKKMPGRRAAVELPHSGMSYNPEPEAHEELTNIAAKQLQRIKDRDAYLSKLIAVDKRVQSSGTNLLTDKGWSEDELESEVVEVRKKPKKTEQERNKAISARRQKVKEKRAEAKKTFNRQFAKLDEIVASRRAKRKIDEELSKLKSAIKKVEKPNIIPNTGGIRHKDPVMPVLPKSQVKKNLRRQSMDSTGTNPVTDRVNSYRARGALPAHKNWGSAHDRRRMRRVKNPSKSYYFPTST
jgi:hypothetical protein